MKSEAKAKLNNPIKILTDEYDQAVWIDYIRRSMVHDGELQRLVVQDGLRGVTSNPAIFEKAIGGSDDYDAQIAELVHSSDLEPGELFERLAVDDIRDAAQILAPVYERTQGADGYVSIEVSPYLAYDTDRTIAEARRLWHEVGLPNIMIKVPGTPPGLPAIQQLISEGINVNVTLLFAQEVYRQVAQAYIAGLEELDRAGGNVSRVAGVASFFVSRIDAMADQLIATKLQANPNTAMNQRLAGLQGKIAIANARLAYQIYLQICRSERWKTLQAKGARPQRLLWASTGTKNPQYSPTLYVDELIGKQTVNTVPPETLEAFRRSGKLRESLTEDIAQSKQILGDLEEVGISLQHITKTLEKNGVTLFADAADKLLSAVAKKRFALLGKKHNIVAYNVTTELPEGSTLSEQIDIKAEEWRKEGNVRRLWNRDAGLWTGNSESKWLDWLTLALDRPSKDVFTGVSTDPRSQGPMSAVRCSAVPTAKSSDSGNPTPTAPGMIGSALQVVEWVKSGQFKDAVLLGMGGSSLGAEVTCSLKPFGHKTYKCRVHVLDSTDPEQISSVERLIDYKDTCFIVSSKSGTTLEPNLLKDYFYGKVAAILDSEHAGARFVAITDPGSQLELVARHDGFAHVFMGEPGIGGRYSVLSNFGMVPGAVAGLNVPAFLSAARSMVLSCGYSVPPSQNPGVFLGITMGVAALNGRDKLTIITPAAFNAFGSWLEQLVAESTGKSGKGIIPVSGERVGEPSVYQNDRMFVYIADDSVAHGDKEKEQLDSAIEVLSKAGHPVVRIGVSQPCQMGQEYFRFEIAVAVAGSILDIKAFDQTDVEASKEIARQITAGYEREGSLPDRTPFYADKLISLYTDEANLAQLQGHEFNDRSPAGYLKALMSRTVPGDYIAFLAFLARNYDYFEALQSIRHKVRRSTKLATCLGFGPRFLHSTGQLYKGGPNKGIIIQITSDKAADLTIPGHKYTFGIVESAQAEGDFRVLAQRKRRLLRVHLSVDVRASIHALEQAFDKALQQ